MSVGFEKHRSEIVAAWKDVLDDQSTTNWALYSYEGQTNELKVVGSGEGGLEELCDELNSSKIMYAFCRIADPKTGLKKFLIINWQGEGAPVLRKGTCANHIHEVTKLLSGAHLTIAARNEDDIDMERLLKKLSTVSSAYSFKEPRSFTGDQQKAPVGTNYTRVIPTKELNASVMQDFWRKEEEEEKKRLAAEKEAKRLELAKLEQEQRAREEKEHQKREQIVVGGGSKLQPAHVPIKTSPQPLSPEKTVAAFSAGLTEAERMRQMRNQEAKELIGSRVGAAKAIFTKNTSEGQLQTKLNTAPPAKPARTSIAQRINAFNQQDTEQNAAPAKARSPTPGKITLPKEIPTEVVAQQPQQPQQQKVEEPIAEEPQKVEEVEKEAVKPQETIQQPVKPEITAIANADDPFQPGDNNYSAIEPEEQYSTIKRSPHSKSNSLQSPDDNTVVSNSTDTAVYQDNDDDDNSGEAGDEEIICPKISVTTQQSQASKNGMMTSLERNELKDLVNEDDLICQDSWGDLGLRATALYDYQAADESEISFDPGDIITHIDQIDEGWWQGLGPDGTYGLFPANYVEILK